MKSIRGWQSYQHVRTQTASPGQLVVMLYDGAIRFLERALTGFTHEDPLEFNRTISNNLIRAQNIINELNHCLDLEQGGELARTLRALYDYMDQRLTESNLQKTADGIHDTVRRLTVLRDAWQQTLSQNATIEPSEASSGLCACG